MGTVCASLIWLTQVVQADRFSVCLRLRTSAAATPNVMTAASAAADTDGVGECMDRDLDWTINAEHEGGRNADPSIDPFMDMQQGKLPWPWLRSPPGSDKGKQIYCIFKSIIVRRFW